MSAGRPVIFNAEPWRYSSEARAHLEGLGEVRDAPRGLDRAGLLVAAGDADVLIVRLGHQVDRKLIEAAPRLRAIVTATTGLDHVDVDAARARGVEVLSLRGETDFLEGIRATPEHTWALLLALVRHIVPAVQAVQGGQWDREQFRGHELAGKRLGLLGCGRVGRIVAGYAHAFGMRVAAYDPYQVDFPEHVERVEILAGLVARSNVLSLHVHLTEETHGLLNAPLLQQLPPGAFLVNTSRGELVDEQALVDALESGRLAGAALDVVAHERQPEARLSSPLLHYAATRHNLLLTPHLGGATFESMERTEVFMAQKLARFLGQEALVYAS